MDNLKKYRLFVELMKSGKSYKTAIKMAKIPETRAA